MKVDATKAAFDGTAPRPEPPDERAPKAEGADSRGLRAEYSGEPASEVEAAELIQGRALRVEASGERPPNVECANAMADGTGLRARYLGEVPAKRMLLFHSNDRANLFDSAALRGLTGLALMLSCAPLLFLRFLPMQELPQYVATSRMLFRLSDARAGFAPYYELALERSIALLPLWLLGGLAELVPLSAATRIVVCLSVLSYPLGLCALLRAQGKPIAYVLFGLPLMYSSSFYLGLVPSLASTGLALYAIALFYAPAPDRRARRRLWMIATVLPFVHPFGLSIVLIHVLAALAVERSAWRHRPWLALTPLACGAVYWGARTLHADGVAAYHSPGFAYRLFRLPESVLGGFVGRGEAYLLFGFLVLWLWLARGRIPIRRARLHKLSEVECALWLSVVVFALGYLLLPSSTWSTTAIHVRSGTLALALLPAVLPAQHVELKRPRAALLLLALAGCSIGYSTVQLIRFDREAQPFAAILEHIPAGPKLLSLIYENQGKIARGSPYLHFGAYAQAERGGALSLSSIDYAWTVPLRRRADTPALPPVYGSEWDPVLMHDHPEQFGFYDLVVTRGTEPREMTIMSVLSFELVARSSDWILYRRRHDGVTRAAVQLP